MDKQRFFYINLQCSIVLICGIIGLIAVFIKTNLPTDISILFAVIFVFCIVTALFFLVWLRHKRKQEKEDNLIDAIGEAE